MFETLAGLVEKNRKLLNLGENFLEWEARQSLNPGAESNTSEADDSKVRASYTQRKVGPKLDSKVA